MMTNFFSNIRILPAVLAAAIFFAACTGDAAPDADEGNGNTPDNGSLTITSASGNSAANVKFTGGNITLSVTASSDWTAGVTTSDSGSWATLDKTSGNAGQTTVTLVVTGHTSVDERTARITFTCKGESQHYTVTQSGKPEIEILDDGFDDHIPFTGGSITVEFATNAEYTLTLPDWIHQSGQVSNRAMEQCVLTFSVDANDTFEERSGDIVIQSKDRTASKSVSVWQSEKEGILLTAGPEASVPYNAVEKLGLLVMANVDYECRVEFEQATGSAWLTITETAAPVRALESTYIIFNLEENPSKAARSAIITVFNSAKGYSQQLRLIQLAHPDEVGITHTAAKFTLPTLNGGQQASGTVYWGDDSYSEIDGTLVHTYDPEESGREHTVTIQWTPTVSFKLNDLSGVTSIDLSGLY